MVAYIRKRKKSKYGETPNENKQFYLWRVLAERSEQIRTWIESTLELQLTRNERNRRNATNNFCGVCYRKKQINSKGWKRCGEETDLSDKPPKVSKPFMPNLTVLTKDVRGRRKIFGKILIFTDCKFANIKGSLSLNMHDNGIGVFKKYLSFRPTFWNMYKRNDMSEICFKRIRD